MYQFWALLGMQKQCNVYFETEYLSCLSSQGLEGMALLVTLQHYFKIFSSISKFSINREAFEVWLHKSPYLLFLPKKKEVCLIYIFGQNLES